VQLVLVRRTDCLRITPKKGTPEVAMPFPTISPINHSA
jgi:hypothetical protein